MYNEMIRPEVAFCQCAASTIRCDLNFEAKITGTTRRHSCPRSRLKAAVTNNIGRTSETHLNRTGMTCNYD